MPLVASTSRSCRVGGGGVLAANAQRCAARALGGLFALVTKHRHDWSFREGVVSGRLSVVQYCRQPLLRWQLILILQLHAASAIDLDQARAYMNRARPTPRPLIWINPDQRKMPERCRHSARLPAVRRRAGAGFRAVGHDGPAVQVPQGTVDFPRKRSLPGRLCRGQGMVRVFKTGPGGKEHVLHIVGPGGTFAEVAAIGGFDVPASAEAVSRHDLRPAAPGPVPQGPGRRPRAVPGHDDRPDPLGAASGQPDGRHRAARRGRPDRPVPAGNRRPAADGTVDLPSLKRHVASHLNLTSETFSRTFRRLIDAGLIAEADRQPVAAAGPQETAVDCRGDVSKAVGDCKLQIVNCKLQIDGGDTGQEKEQ